MINSAQAIITATESTNRECTTVNPRERDLTAMVSLINPHYITTPILTKPQHNALYHNHTSYNFK